MTSELFDTPESLSPRLAWMKRHSIGTYQIESGEWEAYKGRIVHGSFLTPLNAIRGKTEEDSLVALAHKFKLKLWFEENP